MRCHRPIHRSERVKEQAPVQVSATLLAATCLFVGAGPALAGTGITFTKILGIPPVEDGGGSRSVNWIDADGDGDLDLYVSNGGSPGENNFYYRNDAGSLVPDPANAIANDGTRSVGTTWGDADNDGDSELYVTNWYLERNVFYTNDGGGAFTRATTGEQIQIPTYSESAAFADPDNDGDLDLFVANSGNAGPQLNLYFVNDGTGTFTRVTGTPLTTESRFARHAAWCDADLDGDLDLFIANEIDTNNSFFRNDLIETGTATMTPVALAPITTDAGKSFGASWGDFDNDGDFDLFVANADGQDNRLYRNLTVDTGSLAFELVAGAVSTDGGASIAGHWGDFDNDGDLDLFVGNGFDPDGTTQFANFLYENDGVGGLTRVASGDLVTDLGWTYGAASADYDEDGDLDLFLANWFANDQDNALHRNEAQLLGRHWLTVRCEGVSTNRSGIGARVSLLATIDGLPRWQHRFVSSQESYCGQNLELHFGLGDATVVDSVVVSWPGGGVDVATGVAVDQRIELVEGGSVSAVGDGETGPSESGALGPSIQVLPNPFGDATEVRFELAEAARTALHVRDVGGRLIRRIDAGELASGEHRVIWDGRGSDGEEVSAGVYFVSAHVDRAPATRGERVIRLR